MSNLDYKDKNKILQINYSDKKNIKKFTSNSHKSKFNWKKYVNFYPDLIINNLDSAWDHWVNYGLKEKRHFFTYDYVDNSRHINIIDKPKKNSTVQNIPNVKINLKKLIMEQNILDNNRLKIRLMSKNNLIYKNIYDNYGLHYYGWKEVMNNFIKKFEKKENFKEQIFFDEWSEKFLIWGDMVEKKYYLKGIYNHNYKIVTFCHNPPFHNWYNAEYRKNIKNNIIYNEEHTNKNLIRKIKEYELENQIVFFYTLTNEHKEYLYNRCHFLRTKLLSVSHPIEIHGNEKCFDYSLFCKNKQIIHIGWWLRNFKTFIDFKQPKEFHKTILIKNDFEKEWNHLSSSYKLDNITIIKELSNIEYEKIFTNYCVFIHLIDACANNTILECIKFNTPVIVNKLPGVVEYLGENYPLYYEKIEDLILLNNPDYLLNEIKNANEYLITMNKEHIYLNSFNKKVNYDLNKLDVKATIQLTWFCFIDDLSNIEHKLSHLYSNFVSQNANNKIKLSIVICESLCENENYKNIIEKLNKYSEIMFNIHIFVNNFKEKYNNFLDFCVTNCDTEYLVIIDIDDHHESNYSYYFINYLNENYNVDVAFSSYRVTNNDGYKEDFTFTADTMLFISNYKQIFLPETGIVWRKDIIHIVGKFIHLVNRKFIFRDFWYRVLQNNFNIKCCNNNILYKSIIK